MENLTTELSNLSRTVRIFLLAKALESVSAILQDPQKSLAKKLQMKIEADVNRL